MNPPCSSSTNDADRQGFGTLIIAVTAGVAILLGVVGIAGWLLASPVVYYLSQPENPIHFVTAVCFLLAGLGLFAAALNNGRWSLGTGLTVGLLGLASAVGNLAAPDSGWGRLIGLATPVMQPLHPGHMSTHASICFSLLGIALVLAGFPAQRRQFSPVLSATATVIFGLSLVTVWKSLSMTTLGTGIYMSWAAAVGLMALAAGLFATGSRERTPGVNRLQWGLPVALAGGLTLAMIVLWDTLSRHHGDLARSILKTQAEYTRAELISGIKARTLPIVRMANRWNIRGGIRRLEWNQDATMILAHYPGAQAIEWADDTLHSRWIAPAEGNEELLGAYLGGNPTRRQAFDTARNTGQMTLSGPMKLFRGGTGFFATVPVFKQGRPDGFLMTIVEYQRLFDEILSHDAPGCGIDIYHHGVLVYSRNSDRVYEAAWGLELPFADHEDRWQIRIWPLATSDFPVRSALADTVLVFGLFLAVLLAAAVNFGQLSRRQERSILVINQRLRHEVANRMDTERRAAVFSKLGRDLNETHSLREAAEVIFKTAGTLFSWDSGSFGIYSPKENSLTAVYDVDTIDGVRRETPPPTFKTSPSRLAARAIQEGPQLILRERAAFEADARPLGDTSRPSASLMFTPVRHEGAVVALLTFQSYHLNAFTEESLKALQEMADYAAGAVERIRAEQSLAEDRAWFDRALKSSGIGTWSRELDSSEDFRDSQVFELFGLPPDQPPGTLEMFFNLIHPEDVNRVAAAFEDTIARRISFDQEFRIFRASDGALRHLHARCSVLPGQDGKTARLAGTCWDVTTNKAAEIRTSVFATLGASLAEARSIREAAETISTAAKNLFDWDAFFIDLHSPQTGSLDTVHCVDTIDGEVCHIKPSPRPVEPGSLRWKTLNEGPQLILRQDAQDPAQGLAAFGDKGRPSASLMFTPLRHGSQPLGLISVQSYRRNAFTETGLQDLQSLADHCVAALERIQAEQKIREQAELLDLAQDAITVRDFDQRVLFWNKGAERLLGWSASETLGRPITEFSHSSDDALNKATRATREHGQWTGELSIVTKDGKPLVVISRWTLLRDPEGVPKGVLTISTDVTGMKQMENQFLRAQRMEAIGMLSSGVAHDLNNILAPILMCAPMLREASLPADEKTWMVDMIETNARHGAEVVKQLLTFGRGVSGERVSIQPRLILKELAKVMERTLPKNIRLTVRPEAKLWQVTGDPTQLHQVLLNLCVNARDAMPNGGDLTLKAGNVTVEEHEAANYPDAKPGPHVFLEATDTGSGIPRDILDKIFDPFFTTKPVGQGTGLGLSTVLGIVRSHGGFIRVDSAPGRGTRFKVYLPAQPAEEAVEVPPPEETLPLGRGELILVVDDDTGCREMTRRLLEKHGYRTATAADGSEAVARFAQTPGEIHSVLTDINMPTMDGLALAKVLRRMDPAIQIIAATGRGTDDMAAKAREAGIRTLIQKPFDKARVLHALAEALDIHRSAGNPA